MPIYEYECAACGQFEVMQKITEAPLTSCETCGGSLTKLVSHSSFALKGGGWYKDLYSSSSSGSSSTSSTPSAATTPSSSSSSSASASAAPASPAPAASSPKPDSGGSKTAA